MAKKSTTSKPRQKAISLKSVQQKFKDVNTLSTYVLNKETNEVIKYYEKFSYDRIEDVLREAHKSLQYVAEHNLDYFNNDTEFLKHVYLLIVKHFTHFKDEISDDFEVQIAQFNQLKALGYFDLLFDKLFNPEEVGKVIEKIESLASVMAQIEQLDESTRKEVLEAVQSPVVQKRLKQNAKV